MSANRSQPPVIVYRIADSSLGRLLLARSESGLCAAALDDRDGPLLAWLVERFPGAMLAHAPEDGALRDWVGQVQAYLAGERTALEFPLDPGGTSFQRQVWEALRGIPYGETRTYAQIAAGLGKPGAVRAVGAACGANRIALAIPCHRAVGSDGRLHGFRWGLARKQALLNLERRQQ